MRGELDQLAGLVIEEETGGNGSLSLVVDRTLRQRYDSLVIFDTATNRICPANRGASWFACETRSVTNGESQPNSVKWRLTKFKPPRHNCSPRCPSS